MDKKIVTMTTLLLYKTSIINNVTGDQHFYPSVSVRSKPCLPVCLFPVDGFVEDDPPVTSEQCVSDS